MTRYAALTDPGNQLTHNEDAVASDVQRGLWMVADGMGGHAAGEVASEIATTTILERYSENGSLLDAIRSAHQAIVSASSTNPERQGMGSTIVALAVSNEHATIAWVGDSRAYLWRKAQLTQLSRDHSVLQELIDAGRVSEKSAREHPKRNMITQVLGHGNPQTAREQLALDPGDWLLLCSDGLTDVLNDEQIARVLKDNRDPERGAQALIDAVRSQKPRDNVSVVLVEPLARPSRLGVGFWKGWMMLALAAAFAGAWLWWRG
ncbi:MAG: protein phosphatase 2C domain-containing protein [Pseudomonadota bacterium]